LKEVSQTLNVHPAYLSREFSKYFDDLSFGDYIRKLRIEKAIQLLNDSRLTLTELLTSPGSPIKATLPEFSRNILGRVRRNGGSVLKNN
jgi:transcriptional regulator GlxA family with amidase domain